MGKAKFKRGDKVNIVGYKAEVKVHDDPFLKNETWYYRLNIGMTCAEDLLVKSEATTNIIPKAG